MENSNPLRNLRCHHCAGPLSKEMETSEWTVAPLVRDSFSMIGSAVGGTTSAFYGFNHVMPIVRRYVKGPMWVHFLVGDWCIVSDLLTELISGQKLSMLWRLFQVDTFSHPYAAACMSRTDWFLAAPPVIVFSSACAGLAGGAVPALAQLASSSYHAAFSSSSSLPPSSQDDKMHKSRTNSTL
ncbi:transmembrane protein [Gossypium australe]|uniref:Transmembrane protein n=1 Tax=Gossypium australe TaxID=47621 RepID=A0A5B6VVV3_9ROSI|nr:transmembrane protein [Gossypium australe]